MSLQFDKCSSPPKSTLKFADLYFVLSVETRLASNMREQVFSPETFVIAVGIRISN